MEEVAEEGVAAEEAAEQAEGKMEATTTEAEEGSRRKVAEQVGEEAVAAGEACAPCWSGQTGQREVF